MGYYTKQQCRKRSEATEQETVIQWCRWHEGKYPELKLIYHVPNGGSRNTLEAANLKRQGVKAGVPDLCLPVPKNGLYRNEVREEQNNGKAGRMAGSTAGAGVLYCGVLWGRGSGSGNCKLSANGRLSGIRKGGKER